MWDEFLRYVFPTGPDNTKVSRPSVLLLPLACGRAPEVAAVC
jgi:hypothetical protein